MQNWHTTEFVTLRSDRTIGTASRRNIFPFIGVVIA